MEEDEEMYEDMYEKDYGSSKGPHEDKDDKDDDDEGEEEEEEEQKTKRNGEQTRGSESGDNDNDNDNDNESELVKQFKDLSAVEDVTYCKRVLAANDWDLEAAINAFLNGNAEDMVNAAMNETSQGGEYGSRGSDANSNSTSTSNASSGRLEGQTQGHVSQTQRNLSNLNQSSHSSHSTQSRFTAESQVAATAGQGGSNHPSSTLIASALNSMVSLTLFPLRKVLGVSPPLEARAAARRFLHRFEENYGRTHPSFVELSFQDAVAQAGREDKLLFVFLQSDEHPLAGKFSKDVLGNQSIIRLIDDQMIAWGGDIDQEDAYRTSIMLGASTFPFAAILMTSQSQGSNASNQNFTRVTIVDRIPATDSVPVISNKLSQSVVRRQHTVVSQTAARREAEERTRIRQEQDRALQEAMEEDRKREEREREEAEAKRRAAEEERARQEKEERERREKEQRRAQYIAEIREKIREEPTEHAGYTKTDLSKLLFRFPDGAKLQRNFLRKDTIGYVREFLDVYLYDQQSAIENYALASSYPKRTFQPEETQQKLEDENLAPSSVLLVQDLDA